MRVDLVLLCAVVLAGPAAAALSAAPRPGFPVVAVFWPWADADAAVRAAGGRTIGPQRAPLGVLAAGQSDDFAARLAEEGAFAVFDGAALAQICSDQEVRP
jgi:hypothetical protein